MSFDLPSIDELKRSAESGQRITAEDVSVISQSESELTGSGPVPGGPAGSSLSGRSDTPANSVATAQSLAMKQMNFDTKLDEVSRKPQSHITQEDAREIHATEVFLLSLSSCSQLTQAGPRI